MNNAGANISGWRERLKAELRRDKKRTAILVVLLVVAGIVGGRLLITHSLPEDAKAAARMSSPKSGQAGGAEGLQPAPNSGQSGQTAGGNVAGGVMTAAIQAVTGRSGREAHLATMERKITRDLFKPNLEYFPPAEGAGSRVVVATNQEGLFQQVYQWVCQEQNAQRRHLEQVGAIRAQARALSLQSTVLGRSPTALINGQVLRKGDWISGFHLKAIASNYCIVSKDGVDVELRMRQ